MAADIKNMIGQSFINLLGRDRWTDADITARTEAELAGMFSKGEQDILSRKMIGAMSGNLVLTTAETAELEAYKLCAFRSQQMGITARQHWALLAPALDYEAAQQRLARPALTKPETVAGMNNKGDTVQIANPALALDAAERQAAQSVIDAATPDTLALVAFRNPKAG